MLNHDAPSTMLYCWDEALVLVCSALFHLTKALYIFAKKINFILSCPQNIFSGGFGQMRDVPQYLFLAAVFSYVFCLTSFAVLTGFLLTSFKIAHCFQTKMFLEKL